MKKVIILISTVLLSINTVGLAKETPSQVTNEKNEYFYLGLEGGNSRLYTDPHSPSTWESIAAGTQTKSEVKKTEGWNPAVRLFGGYLWKVTDKFYAGAELGAARYSGNEYDFIPINRDAIFNVTLEITQYQFDLLGVAKYSFTPAFNVFAKAGGVYAVQRYTPNTAVGGVALPIILNVLGTETRTKILPKLVIGAGYDFTPRFGVTLSVSRLFASSDTGVDKNTRLASAGAGLRVTGSDSIMAGIIYRFV